MSVGRRVVLTVSLLPLLTACRQTPEAKAAELHKVENSRSQELARRIAQADADPTKAEPIAMWIMPPGLNEISGLALTTRGTVLTHDDNVGRVYEIDPRTGVLHKSFSLLGNPKADFEAITIVGSDIYLMTSDAKLFSFKEGADGTQVPYSIFDTGLGKQCEFEGLAYEADSSRLVMACKRFLAKEEPHALLIYRLPLPLGDRSTISSIRVPIQEVAGSNNWKNFRASDISIDPFTKNYVIIASHEKGLIEVTPDGDVVRSEPLPGDHRQPEGVAVTKDSLLLISDEANVKPPSITVYRWRP
ncbi:MAG: SdiA-regulated domain-containing protein [Gemmatimonadaceae bacterium]